MASMVDDLRRQEMMKASGRIGYQPKPPGTGLATQAYKPNWTIPDPKIEAKFAADSAASAHGERVNPSQRPAPTFAPNDARAYGDGRFGAPANGAAQTAQPTQATPRATAMPKPSGPFYSKPLSQMAGGAAKSVGGSAKGAARFLSAPLAVGAAGIAGAAQGFGTDTEQYAKRFGLEDTEPGVLRDLGIRGLGVASDVGNSLTLGLAGNLFRDRQDQTSQGNPLIQAAQAQTVPSAANPVRAEEQPAVSAAATPTPTAKEIQPGVFEHGRGQFSDSPDGMNLGTNTGKPNAQNAAAADQLAQRYQSNPLVQASQPQGPQTFTPQDTGGYGLLDKGYRDRRAAMMDAQQLKPGARTALSELLKQQGDVPNQQMERDKMAQGVSENALDRQTRSSEFSAKLGESAADRSLRSQEVNDNSLTNKLKREATSLDMNNAKQLQSAQDAYLNAKTDAERESAAKRLQVLNGKANQTDEYMSVSSGQTVDAQGIVTKSPDLIVNKRTGQVVNGGQAQRNLPPIGDNPQAMQIKNDTSMSVDQKRAALQKLGY